MDLKTEKKIISEYNKGKSSLQITKIVGLSKPTILKVLNKHNLVRKRDRCKSLNIKKKGGFYQVKRKCPKCNQDIITKSKDKGIACRNHFNKINGTSLCKPCSLKLQVGEGNPFYGKKHTEKTKKIISKSRTGLYTGHRNHMKKEKYRKMSRDIMRSNWENGILDRKVISEQMKQTQRSGKIKSTIVSKKEKEIVKKLKQLGYRPIHSYRVDTKICDIFIPSLNLIIEYFGDYWHCNPNKYESNYYNKKKSQYAKDIWEYDKNKIDLIKSYGYNLEVIWESDLKHDKNKITKLLINYDSKNRITPERSRKD